MAARPSALRRRSKGTRHGEPTVLLLAATTILAVSSPRSSLLSLWAAEAFAPTGRSAGQPHGRRWFREPTAVRVAKGLPSSNSESDAESDGDATFDPLGAPSTGNHNNNNNNNNNNKNNEEEPRKKKVVVIGAGWGGLSTAQALGAQAEVPLDITVVDAAPRAGGLVRDGFATQKGKKAAEAGQHGFWDNYHNIFALLERADWVDPEEILTGYAEQGQYSPSGLEAVWPVYRQKSPALPTGLAQALYTRFRKLPPLDRASAAPLVLAFSEFDDSPGAWEKYDSISFRDLCVKLGVSKRCYREAFEPMILTGLFAPGAECSAAAALGMAYFFVLKSQNSFDVRWCKGNIGERIFQPWVENMEQDQKGRQAVSFRMSTRVTGFETDGDAPSIRRVLCETTTAQGESEQAVLEADEVVFAVGGAALSRFVQYSPVLARHAEFRRFANLRGTGVLATRIYLDRFVDTPYSANACWGFDEGVGMTFFDITKLHGVGKTRDNEGSILEVDYYHAASLLVMDNEAIVEKVKSDLDTILGKDCKAASVVDAAVVKLPQAVNWYSPGSYANMPDVKSSDVPNVYFAGDLVKTRHGSWSQEKAYVTGIEAANAILQRRPTHGILPLDPDEFHVALGRKAVSAVQRLVGKGDPSRAPSLVDFLW
ncbi:unnamed protein product [Pseudo-nitzschia multistriata]|uniref:Amine oxidase domain-containing protein n=1 Tax=Pseudo-nitzschia multistriata TaxID=183589 RepID=A0A448ZC46_9STRA|nr:unnamed protein product [Pseudo-nitzschia multistriata]